MYVLKCRFYFYSSLVRPTDGEHGQFAAVPKRQGHTRPPRTTWGSTGARGRRRKGRA